MKKTRIANWPMIAAAVSAALAAAVAQAKNVDLSTVPDRDTVQLTIYNSEDLTLVRETRKISFRPGVNPLQFSWANTLIDPTSVELKFLTQADKLELLDTTFPHDKPQMLYWSVQSEMDGEAVVQITYFTSGISWAADYVCVANADETLMRFEGFVRVSNNSGEEYENAQVRLVVGTINLVEKIAELARIPLQEVDRLAGERRAQLQFDAFRKLAGLGKKELLEEEGAAEDSAGVPARPKQIIKEGLSEYFLYTIEGEETIPDGWSKRMRSFQGASVPLAIEYRYREPEYGGQFVRMYLLTNDAESGLGATPLPDGIVRVFRASSRDGFSFLVAQNIKYVPIGDKIELNLGPDRNVVFELVTQRVWRDNIWMRVRGADVYRRADDGRIKIEANSTVAGWDEHRQYVQRIRNYTAKPIDVEVRRSFDGHVEFRGDLQAKNHDYRTVQYRARVKPGEKADLRYQVLQHEGRNKKQNNVTLVPAG